MGKPHEPRDYEDADETDRIVPSSWGDTSVTDPHQKIADSARHLDQSAEKQTDSADRRTQLAADRTVLAAERTYAAWVRTGLAALASAIGARALLEGTVPHWLVGATGSVLALFSAFCFFAAVWRELKPVAPPPEPDTRRMPPAVLLGINGFLMIVAIAALVGIWTAHPALPR